MATTTTTNTIKTVSYAFTLCSRSSRSRSSRGGGGGRGGWLGSANPWKTATATSTYTAGARLAALAALKQHQQHPHPQQHRQRTSSSRIRDTYSRRAFALRESSSSSSAASSSSGSSSNHTRKHHHPPPHNFDYDFLVIGAGSGGIAAARRAAMHGARVAIVEARPRQLGGTCVNEGCVPKKIMWNAAHIADTIRSMAPHYGFRTIPDIHNNHHHDPHDHDPLPSWQFDWQALKVSRDAYIARLNGIYARNLDQSGVQRLSGRASLLGDHRVRIVTTTTTSTSEFESSSESSFLDVSAQHILIATGGRPWMPETVPGLIEHAISSDGFFALQQMPTQGSIVVVGAGYIAVELAGVLHSLGAFFSNNSRSRQPHPPPQVHLVLRKESVLRDLDPFITSALMDEMTKQGLHIHKNTGGLERIELTAQTNDNNGDNDDAQTHAHAADTTGTGSSSRLKSVYLKNGHVLHNVECVIMAAGRQPNVEALNLSAANVDQVPTGNGMGGGYIQVDDYSSTSAPGIYAVGDVIGKVQLTPTAIAAGRRLADRLFGRAHVPAFAVAAKSTNTTTNTANHPPKPNNHLKLKISYDNVPTVIFSHPPIGTVGLSEAQARAHYASEHADELVVRVYTSTFANLYYGLWPADQADSKPKTVMKLVTVGLDERIVGLHVMGMGADELLQGFAVALRMGATKADFDATMAIHPTAAEEFVTMFPWGMSPSSSSSSSSSNSNPPSPSPRTGVEKSSATTTTTTLPATTTDQPVISSNSTR